MLCVYVYDAMYGHYVQDVGLCICNAAVFTNLSVLIKSYNCCMVDDICHNAPLTYPELDRFAHLRP